MSSASSHLAGSVLTIDSLFAMSPIVNGQDIVQLAARHVFLTKVKSQLAVRDVFFSASSNCNSTSGRTFSANSTSVRPRSWAYVGDNAADCPTTSAGSGFSPLMTSEQDVDDGDAATMTSWFDFGRYSVLLAAQAICRNRDEFRIHEMLDEQEIDEQLKRIHDSSGWKKIGRISCEAPVAFARCCLIFYRLFSMQEPPVGPCFILVVLR